ncbi:FliI/YscN family ATPase [Chachezhania antarctica]|uniref:FliI/YscN family ATPase n=1 Tax=Chachezhania antarctica TaxID=2340860 RepID=UPI000EB2219B|nr:FliI/YscN family ATPase [Chachezhania antarctica]
MPQALESLINDLQAVRRSHPSGLVASVGDGVVRVDGLERLARIGDRAAIRQKGGKALHGEVMAVGQDDIQLFIDGTPDGIAVGDRVVLTSPTTFAPCDGWLGRIIDPYARPLDNRPLPRGHTPRTITAAPPPAAQRRGLGARLSTGMAVLNTLLPLVEGQRVGLFAGSGVGKSRLLSHLTREVEADIVVVALIGERGREVSEFVRRVLGPDGMTRTVIVAATSDQSALTRRRCAGAAMTVAEHFRDKGLKVLFLADSITRYAEAHREIAAASGELPALRGFPASVVPLITGLCERAGPGIDGMGDITAVFSVLVAGSDMDEPIADILRGVLDGHIVLSREIAERGRYPAIDVSRSVSRSLPDAASDDENKLINEARALLGAYERSEVMIRAGLYAEGSDLQLDRAVRIWSELDTFFAKTGDPEVKASFDRLALLIRRAG